MSALLGAGAAAVPGIGGVAGTGMMGTMQKLLTGFPLSGTLGYLTLMFLTVFPITGIAGLNLVAAGQPITAFLKFSSVAISVILMTFLAPYLPLIIQGTWMTWLAGIGPWYIFDVIQMMDHTDFMVNGFRSMIPIAIIPSGGGKEGAWMLTSTFINLFLATIAGSGQLLPALFPNTTIGGVSTKTIGNSISIGGGSALGVSALASLAAVAFAPAAVGAGAVGMGAVTHMGGGPTTPLPPLSKFIETLSTTTVAIGAQSGGSTASKSDKVFLSELGFVAIAGLTLGFAMSARSAR